MPSRSRSVPMSRRRKKATDPARRPSVRGEKKISKPANYRKYPIQVSIPREGPAWGREIQATKLPLAGLVPGRRRVANPTPTATPPYRVIATGSRSRPNKLPRCRASLSHPPAERRGRRRTQPNPQSSGCSQFVLSARAPGSLPARQFGMALQAATSFLPSALSARKEVSGSCAFSSDHSCLRRRFFFLRFVLSFSV